MKGRDTFVYNALSDARDLITDFNPAEDLIDFSAILAAPGYDSEDPFNAYIQLKQLAPGLTLVSLDPNGDAPNAFPTPMRDPAGRKPFRTQRRSVHLCLTEVLI